jgi:hypothetical protein
MQVLKEPEAEDKEQQQPLQKPIVKKKKRLKKVSASRKAYLKRIKSTPYIENINIIDEL